MKFVNVLILGCGNRGTIYAEYAKKRPDKFRVKAVSDPKQARMRKLADEYDIDDRNRFFDWRDAIDEAVGINAVIIALPDSLHFEAASLSLERGYNVLLEKPMATRMEDCRELVVKSKESDGILQVCHVLRYNSYFRKLKSIVDEKIIGDIVGIQWSENVAYYHYAHSYIRGNWRSGESTGPFILTKSSHDLDLIYWLVQSLPRRISSFGSQSHFGINNKPEGAPSRCLDNCPVASKCLYYAPRIYLDIVPNLHVLRRGGNFFERVTSNIVLKHPVVKKLPLFSAVNDYRGWPVNVITENPTMENRYKALMDGPYGRCVYDIDDHSVVDNQVTNIEFQNDVVASFMLHGHSSEEGREFKIVGTRGNVYGKFGLSEAWIYSIDSLSNTRVDHLRAGLQLNHGGGDLAIVEDFVENVLGQDSDITTSGEESLISHIMAFKADESRRTGKVLTFPDY